MANAAAPKRHTVSYATGLETRHKRRTAVLKVIDRLKDIQYNEEAYLYNTPENLQNSEIYANTEDNVSYLQDAIATLMDAYE
jgi:hypothetical protein